MKIKHTILLIAIAAALLSSCKTTQCVPQIEYVKQDSIITRTRIDSVLVREKDSVFIDRAGDTICLTKIKYIYKDRITNRIDTIYQDKVQEVVQTETKTERYTPPFYRFTMWFFWIVVAALLIWVVWKIIKANYFRR